MLDQPINGSGVDAPFLVPAEEPAVLESIQTLVHCEPFAVLCTQAGGQPHASLVAFAFSEDLRSFVFATPVATRKYRLLSECGYAALLVDNRSRYPDDVMKVSAVTVTGQASQVAPGADFLRWADLLTARHAYLKSFVHSPSNALFRVEVVRYLHVTRFQEVRQWSPAPDG